MTTEILQLANEIVAEIKRLEAHVEVIQKVAGEQSTLSITASGYSNKNLLPVFMPTTLQAFISMYVANVGAEVIRLKKQLDNLK